MERNAAIRDMRFLVMPCNNRGTAMLFVIVLAMICSILIASVSFTSRYSLKKSGDRRVRVSALNIAEAGKERFYAAILHEGLTILPNSSVLLYADVPFGNGRYSVSYTTGADPDLMSLDAIGVDGGGMTKLEVKASKERTIPLTGMAARLPGTILSRGNVNLTGTINIDGHDHDSTGSRVGTGTYGVYTCLTLNMGSNACTIGGNGVEPVRQNQINPVRSFVCRENAPITSQFNSPEALLGLPEGSLDEFKVSPADFLDTTKGLVYITGSIHLQNFNNFRGIMIVHNATNTAELSVQQGTFRGLLIVDIMDRINGQAQIVGAVATLSPSTNSTFGNGGANLLYSSQVLNNLHNYCQNVKWKISELSWREVP